MRIYLERVDVAAGMARFYAVKVVPNLFGEWTMLREWGRIGQGGTVRDVVFGSEIEALGAAITLVRAKQRRGYVEVGAAC